MFEESPIGTWTIEVQNDGRSVVELKSWTLLLHGIADAPSPNIPSPKPSPPPPRPVAPSPSVPKKGKSGKKVVPAESVDVVSSLAHTDIDSANLAVSSLTVENCDVEVNAGWCDSCDHGYLQLNGRCVASCPSEGFFEGKSGRHEACIPCYYACKTCSGPNDYQVHDSPI
jgi:hypothetical protein